MSNRPTLPEIGPALAVGLGGGLLSGFFGVGGGIVMVPLILWLLKSDRHKAHATSLAAIFIIALSGVIAYGRNDAIDFSVGLALGVGGLIGAWVGAQLMHRMSPDSLRLIFALILLVAGFRMVFT